MWGAQFVSNTGSWMQTVAAQWLMLSLTTSATYVALVQTAASLPVVLFAVLAGTIGDLVDRRKLLLITQAIMLIAAAALGALAIAGLITTWTLLALLFAVGTGQALTSLTGQTLQPELVSPDERPQAISLGAVNQNLARAVGPAIGGVILAATGAGTVFLINAISFAAVIGVIVVWRSSRPVSALPREHVGEAVRAGGRYVAASPVLRVILGRAGLFIFFASAIWALLPLTARSALHLGSGGYGLLLAAVGVGALAGAGLLPRLRGRLTPGTLAALRETRFSRRRTGASSWRAWQDATDPGRILEQFVVPSWAEHQRQHQRVTQHDQERLDRARALNDPARPPTVTHWLAA
jgi:MFS family permease